MFPRVRLDEAKLRERLNGKTVVITGASYGIGEQLSLLLAPTGARLVLVARTAYRLEQLKQEIEKLGGTAWCYPTDLSEPEQVRLLVSRLQQLPGGIDIIVSNAGKSIRRSVFESLDRMHDITRTIAINYTGPVQLLLSLIPGIKNNKGHIIHVSAVNVLMAPAPYWAAYQASKTAFDQWFRCVAPELNGVGVTTTSVYLPLVRTRMIAPTPAYAAMPAMSALQAATIMCNCIIYKKKKYTPWWLIFGRVASFGFPRTWETAAMRFFKK